MRNATLVTCSLTIAGSLLTIARADEIPPDARSRVDQPRTAAAAHPQGRENADSVDSSESRVATDHGCVKPDAASEAGARDAPQPADVSKRIVFGP
jgi:hypothetical protein